MTYGRRLIALGGLAFVLVTVGGHYRFFDMAIYQGAVRWWVHGGELYAYQAPVQGGLGFTYPPFAALLLLPTTLVPTRTAGWLITVLSLLALAAVLRVLRLPGLLLVAALITEPVRQNLGLGQVNLLLFALVVVDLAGLGRAGSRWTGVGVGIATAVKLTPGLFIVYLLVTRQWRAARTATATVAGLTVAAAVVAPRETVQYFGRLLWQTGRVGAADAVANQSLAGLLARLPGEHTVPTYWWLGLCAVAVVAGLRRAAVAHTYGLEVTALTVTGLVANLVTPVAWTHHLVFLPVAIVLLCSSPRWPDVAAAAACYTLGVLSPIWWGDGFLAANTFVLMTVFLLWRLPVRPRPAPGGDAAPGSGTMSGCIRIRKPAGTLSSSPTVATGPVPGRSSNASSRTGAQPAWQPVIPSCWP